jgi:hypothetical protein
VVVTIKTLFEHGVWDSSFLRRENKKNWMWDEWAGVIRIYTCASRVVPTPKSCIYGLYSWGEVMSIHKNQV